METGKPQRFEVRHTHPATGQVFEAVIEIDVEAVARTLVARCIVSKGGKAQLLHGDIKAQLLKPGKGS